MTPRADYPLAASENDPSCIRAARRSQACLTYPSKSVKMVVGFSPGGGTDILARIVGQKLSEAWGQPVIIENRPGASATIGANVVAQAPPDGYTLSMGQLTPNAIAPALMKLPYDAARDFVPIILVGTSPNVLVLNPSVPAKDVAQRGRITRVRQRNQNRTGPDRLVVLVGRVVKGATAGQTLGDAGSQSGGLELRAGGAKNGLWCPENLQQLPGFAGAQARRHTQSQPVKSVVRS